MPDSYLVPVDSSQAISSAQIAPLTNRPNTALLNYQGGMCLLGSDYGSTAKAQIPKVDANGSQYCIMSSPSGGNAQVYTGQAAGVTTTQYGTVTFGRQDLPTPSTFNPVTLDPVGALNVHPKSKPTFKLLAANVTCGTNLILLALYNGSSMVLRLNDLAVYIPPAGGSGGALLGSSSGLTYYPVFCELRRITTYNGGSSITPVAADSGDTLASGVTAASAVSSVASTLSTFHMADAYATNMTGIPFFQRGDGSGKTMVIRPGEGFSLVCTSNGTVNNTVAGGSTTTAKANIMATFTQANG